MHQPHLFTAFTAGGPRRRRAPDLSGLAWTLLLALLWTLPSDAQEAPPRRLTLEQAVALAFETSPELEARRGRVEEARGRRVAARTYPFNPEVGVEAARRRSPGGDTTDRGVTVSQEIEIAGRRRKRTAVATADLAAAEAIYLRDRQLLAARVELAFIETVRTRELLAVEGADATLARDFVTLTQRRLEAGATSQIELNLARAAAGRAARRDELARAAHLTARTLLAEAVGLDPAAPPEPEGGFPGDFPEPPPLADLLARAGERRGDLEALLLARDAAEARLRLARAAAIPDLTLEGFYAEEEDSDRITGLGLSIPLPLFRRNQGGVAEARAAVARAGAEAAAGRLAVTSEVAGAHAAFRGARAAARRLEEQVSVSLDENLALLQRSYAAGKIGAAEVLIFRRELVDAQRELIETRADAWRAATTLDLAAGRRHLPAGGGSQEDPS